MRGNENSILKLKYSKRCDMSSFIDNLNQWGGNFLNFAWPMLWQSSLLIIALFLFDFLFRRKVRASIRYALWLVVLVKLCMPPTLALPTSPAWWLHQTPPPVAAKAKPHYTVTYDNSPLPKIPPAPLPASVPPKPTITNAAWLLVTSAAVSSALLGWLLVRWWQITRQVRHAKTSARLTALASEAQTFVGTKFKVQVKLTTNAMSPAVCGLFRPAILIPQSLADNFSDEQLRAVLLHELIHLRRRDVWLNFLQTLLQIAYWWHPLVWLANTRIRRVREEAVDDAVMLALRDKAEAYAPTLLEVAKLALNRPLASLGLVGILESRHALRQRIERLVDFHPPRQAGLTLASLLGILAFTAVAVPMGGAPGPAETQTAPVALVPPPTSIEQRTNHPSILIQGFIYQMRAVDFEKIVLGLTFNPAAAGRDSCWSASPEKFSQLLENLKSSRFRLITKPRIQTSSGIPASMYVGDGTNGIEFDCTPFVAGGLVDLTIQGKVVDAKGNEAATNQFNAKTSVDDYGGIVIRMKNIGGSSESNVVVITGVQLVTNTVSTRIGENTYDKKIEAGRFVQDAMLDYEMGKLDEADKLLESALALDPENAAAIYYLGLVQAARQRQNVIKPSEGRQEIIRKLQTIRWDSLSFEALPLSEVVRTLSSECKKLDPDHRGFNFMINSNPDETAIPMVDSITGLPMATNAGYDSGLTSIPITINPPMTNVALGDVLNALVKAAPEPIHYTVEDYAIVFSAGKPLPLLYARHFRVDANKFMAAMQKVPGIKTNNLSAMAGDFFITLGVDLNFPGKSVFFNDGLGELFVRATANDLDTVENALEAVTAVAPQIHIKAYFMEVRKGTLSGFGLESVISVTNQTVQSNQVAGLVGILTENNFKTVWHNLETRPGVEIFAEPEVVTTSGRQTQMRATQIISAVTDFTFQKRGVISTDSIEPQMSKVEIGPVLDVVPYVLSDGYMINLKVTPSLVEFLGYDKPPDEPHSRFDPHVQLPVVLPSFRVRQTVATLNLWDGQTVILEGLPEKDYVSGKETYVKQKSSDKELLVFITVTLVDPAGNRIHTDEELPFAKDGIPSQPK